MPCPRQTFSDFTQERFDCLLQKAAGAGLAIHGATGETSANGITIAWSFDPETRTLEIECKEAPFFLPCAMVDSRIREIVESC